MELDTSGRAYGAHVVCRSQLGAWGLQMCAPGVLCAVSLCCQ